MVAAVPMHDTASSLLCMGNQSENNLLLSFGTYANVATEIKDPIINTNVMKAGFANEGAAYKNICLVYNSTGLAILRDCIQIWRKAEKDLDYNRISHEAEEADDLSTYFDPRGSSFLINGNMVESIKKYCKGSRQKIPKTRGELARIIYNSLVMNCKLVVDRLKSITKESYESLHIVSGGSKDGFLCQCVADALNARVIAGPAETPSIGNIIAQLKACGELRGKSEIIELVNNSFDRKEYFPKNPQKWDDDYGFCKKLWE
jgi:sugar (pentulose or hexulose) kinase